MIEFWTGIVIGFLVGAWASWTYGRNEAAFQCILDMLAESPEPMYGLDMINRSGGQLARGTVYVQLGRMQDHGLIEATEPDNNGRRRYRLARRGGTEKR
jgi:DNA-binding PadR family transcriptional regulator